MHSFSFLFHGQALHVKEEKKKIGKRSIFRSSQRVIERLLWRNDKATEQSDNSEGNTTIWMGITWGWI